MDVVQKYKTGDRVQLKSGGPTMTVLKYRKGQDLVSVIYGRTPKPDWDTDIVYCQWFDDKKILKGAEFNQEMLQLVD